MKNQAGTDYLTAARLEELLADVRTRWPGAMLIPNEYGEIGIFVRGETTTEGDYVGRIAFTRRGRVVAE